MAPLDWNQLMALNLEQLQDDTLLADDLYNVLAEFDIGSESDVGRLTKLFQVTQSIMVVKGVAAEVVEEQLNEQALGEGRSTAKKDQEILDLKDEVLALKREIADVKRFGTDGVAGKDIKSLRDEVYELEGQVANLQRELNEREKQLSSEKKLCEEYMKKAEESEKKIPDLRADNEHLQDSIRDYQRQLEAQREQILQSRGGDVEAKSKVSEIRKQLNIALDENILLQQQMEKRDEEAKHIEKQLADGKIEIERTLDEYLKLRNIVEGSDSLIDSLQRENAGLKEQIDDLIRQLKAKADSDDEIMNQVSKKVEEWKEILANKDTQIVALKQQMAQLRNEVNVANMDTDRKSVSVLSKAIEEKDQYIEQLTSKLNEARVDLDDNHRLIKDIHSKVLESNRDPKNPRRAMSNMQTMIAEHEGQLKDMETRLATAEAEVDDKDKQLQDVLIRLSQYEQGIYGLPEAVAEIKKLKEQVKERERSVEDFVQSINRCEEQINVLYDEVEELRDRLGLDPREPINIDELRHKKMMHINQDRALNRVLNKEIERLEEERLQLKMQIRQLVKTPGRGLVDLPVDDTVSAKNVTVKEKLASKADEAASWKYKQLLTEQERAAKTINSLSEEKTSLKTQNNELETENRALQQALQDIREQSERTGNRPLQCPALENYLEMVNSRNVVGRHDVAIVLKAQVDNLTGRNDELRRELRDVRLEAAKAHENSNQAYAKLESLEMEVKALREAGGSGGGVSFFQPIPLPEGLAVSSSEVISSLNEHLIVALQELSLREKMVDKMELALENYQRKFAIMRHQHGLLYQEHAEQKKNFECEVKRLSGELSNVVGKQQEDNAQLLEFNRLLDTLAQDEAEVRCRLAEMTRTITVLRVNEKILSRKYTIAQQTETCLRRENNRLRKDIMTIETAVTERLGYLQRHKDMASFKISALQKALDDSVPASEFELANKQFTELTEKYRDKLETTKSLIAFKEEASGYQSEVKRLQDESNTLTKELAIEKEKLHTLEAAFERMRKQGTANTTDLHDNDLVSVAHRLTTLEMKELNERQRAEHASRMYEQQKNILRQLEDRNFELECKFSELTRVNLEMQTVDSELRDELAKCVPKSVSDADRKRIADLEETEARLRNETSKLKEISDIATNQVQTLQLQQHAHDKELTSLRQQLIDIQAQSDEKTVIGKLHRNIVQMQFSEGAALRQLDSAMKKIIRLEAQLTRTEQVVDEKQRDLYHHRVESRNKVRYLRHTIQDLRRKYTGAVPLSQQEKFAELMRRLQENQRVIEEDLKRTNEQRCQVEDKLAQVELQHRGLQELMATLKDGHGAQKVAKWQAKMETVNLENVRLKRETDKFKDQIKYLESIIKKHEAEVLTLEEDKVRLKREFESSELEWEQREVELERTITNLERQQSEIAGAASQFEEAVGRMPDAAMSVTHQLEQAVTTIKRNVKLILDAKAQAELFKKKVEELEVKVKEKERDILSRDRVIAELRLRLPSTADRDALFDKVTGQRSSPRDENYESSQAIRIATSTVASLQARIAHKEESLSRYEQLLRQTRDEMAAAARQHEDEMRTMQRQLHEKNEHALNTYKMAVKGAVNQPSKPIASNDQLKRLNELEDIVCQQDNTLAELREKISRERETSQMLKVKLADAQRCHEEDSETLKERCREEVSQINDEKLQVESVVSELKERLDATIQELEEQKEANARAPSQTIKNQVEKLKNQLALEKTKNQALSKALLDTRADLVTKAESDVLANAERGATEINVQRIVDKKTKELQERVEELSENNQKLKGDLRRLKDKEATLTAESDEIKEELTRKDHQLKRLKEEKNSLANEVEELRGKVQRISTMNKQRGESESIRAEVDELRRKNQTLCKELERAKMQAEKPLEQQASVNRVEAVSKWEEGKKWQKKVETLQFRLKEKDAELDRLSKAYDSMKYALDRANADKESVEAKMRLAKIPEPVGKQYGANFPSDSSQDHGVQDLKKRIHDLEDECASLKRQLLVGRDSAMEEVQLRNKFLSEKLENLERALAGRQSLTSVQDRGIEYRELAQREDDLQKRVIRLSEENMELRFEVEQANKDIPRLKERNEDLQKYIEVLKAEKQQMELMSRSRDSFSSLLSSPSGTLRRIGESGRTPEQLEKAVAVLKKLVEKTKAENERLKKLPSFVSADQLSNLQAENAELRSRFDDLRQKMGASLSDRYSSQQKSLSKITADYEKVCKDLSKEKDANEKLRMKVRELELSSERHRGQTDQEDFIKQPSASNSTLNDVKAWKLKARLCDEKIKELEDEVDKKVKQMANMKILLRDSADRERQLMQEKHELEEKISVLERLPPGAKGSDTELMKEFQLSRLRNDRLENEKKELLHELQTFRLRSGSGGTSDIGDDELLSKLKAHDRLTAENVDLMTKMKFLQLDKDRLQTEVDKLKNELSNFGPEFFDEIEELKFQCHEATEQCRQYEEQLSKLSKQFGVSINIPPKR